MQARNQYLKVIVRITLAVAAILAYPIPDFAEQSNGSHWVGTWMAAVTGSLASAPVFNKQTLREIVHTSVGGNRVRVRFSNRFGSGPLVIGAAHIAIRRSGWTILPESDRVLTFSGHSSATVPPGAPILSDPVELVVPSMKDLAISIYLPGATPVQTAHWGAQQTSYVSPGDTTGSATLEAASKITFWPFLTGVDVAGPETAEAVVALGDSITDGAESTRDSSRRWPDILAARLLARDRLHPIAVLNGGIGGNRIMHDGAGASGPNFGPSALERFDRDVLVQAGIKYVIVLEGINDIGHPGTSAPIAEEVTVAEIIAGLQQLIERTHEKGFRIFGGTILPFEGTQFPGYYTPERDVKRQKVNEWIRNGKTFDGVIDFEQALRDPKRPTRLLRTYDSGDHLHPNDAGYKRMGDSIDLSLFLDHPSGSSARH